MRSEAAQPRAHRARLAELYLTGMLALALMPPEGEVLAEDEEEQDLFLPLVPSL